MAEPNNLPDAKLYRAISPTELVPFVPDNQFQLSTTKLGTRLIFSTNEDRIEMFKHMLDLYPGPFFITVVVQEPHGALVTPGRMYSERDKTRVQIDYFLDYFHDYISFGGMFHLWISCQSSDGIIVYDQHDYFFVYQRAQEAAAFFRERGYREQEIELEFDHAHSERIDIVPGTKEMLDYGNWMWSQLELTDVARPRAKSMQILILKFRHWFGTRKLRRKNRQ